jgi:hypothetical protein
MKLLRVGASGVVEEVDVATGGSGAINSLILNFGTAAKQTHTISFAHLSATLGQRVIASPDGESDELELEPLAVSAWVSAADTISLRASTLNQGAFSGTRRINYQVA